MSSSLIQKKSQANAAKLPDAQREALLPQVPGWTVQNNELRREFNFKNYYETISFVNATAWVSNRENHHPDMEVGYNKVVMRYSTHSAGGLTENDFICAARINALSS